MVWCIFALSAFLALLHLSLEYFAFSAFLLGFSLLWSYVLAQALFSRERLWIDARGLDHLSTDGLVRRRRMIPHSEVRRLTPYSVMVRGWDSQPPHPEYGLAIETLGRTLRVGQSRDPDAVDQLYEEVRRNLLDWYPAWVKAPECPDCEVLDASGMRAEPPSDSTISCRREWDRTEFVLRNPADRFTVWRCRPMVWVLLLFAPLLLLPLASGARLLIGCLLLAGWLGVALQSVSLRRRWVVRPGEITASTTCWGLGASQTTEIEWLDRIELRRIAANPRWASNFQLAPVDLDGQDKMVFGPLTEGEARWMAGIVADVLKDALPRSGQEIYRWSVAVDEPTTGSRAMADAWLDEGLAGPGVKGSPTGDRWG
jgi:hypothetical protein